MHSAPLLLNSYPNAILHVDADAFFASVEQALRPELRGKAVVTGQERGIVACPSYEAKARGVRRGAPIYQALRACPGLIVLPSDYETYSLFSKRLFAIMRRFTPVVEEYSIDEAFADITGLRRVHRASYEEIGRRIQEEIRRELDLTVSVGLSLTKTLAKLCSKFRKPNGFTGVCGRHIHLLLQKTEVEKVWGFGPNTAALLRKHGVRTAYDYVSRSESWAKTLLHKPGHELWRELRGESVWPVDTEEKSAYATITKSKTFTPPSTDRNVVFARLARNLENAMAKARRYKLRPGSVAVVLRRQDFEHVGLEARLSRPSASTHTVFPIVRRLFDNLFRENQPYRATLVTLGRLESDYAVQYELFEDPIEIERTRQISLAVDRINEAFGKYTVCSAVSLFLGGAPASGGRNARSDRFSRLAPGETVRRHLRIPRLGLRV